MRIRILIGIVIGALLLSLAYAAILRSTAPETVTVVNAASVDVEPEEKR